MWKNETGSKISGNITEHLQRKRKLPEFLKSSWPRGKPNFQLWNFFTEKKNVTGCSLWIMTYAREHYAREHYAREHYAREHYAREGFIKFFMFLHGHLFKGGVY